MKSCVDEGVAFVLLICNTTLREQGSRPSLSTSNHNHIFLLPKCIHDGSLSRVQVSFYQGNGKTKYVRDFVETNIFPMVIATEELNNFLKSIQIRGSK